MPPPPLPRRSARRLKARRNPLQTTDQAYAMAASVIPYTDTMTPSQLSDFHFAYTLASESIPSTKPGDPGTDPSPFIPEPHRLSQVIKKPLCLCDPWLAAWRSEVIGLFVCRKCFSLGLPGPAERVYPLMELFKCKIDANGLIDKLKCCIVFCGDIYNHHNPNDPQDSWNPHATWTCLCFHVALCAAFGIFPSQIDFVMAYVQADMRAHVFVMLPAFLAKHISVELQQYCGRPLLLLKALYGYTFSGKFLYDDQSEFLLSQKLRPVTGMPALWVCHLSPAGIHLVLTYSDDWLSASTDPIDHNNFHLALKQRFEHIWIPRASWYLQACITQDIDGNIFLDQQRYAKSIIS